MPKSGFAHAVDEIQRALRPTLADHGFKCRGRAFNHATDDGLTHVIKLQMGPSDPPGTPYVPGLTENLHGLFTVNLGVFVPEVAHHLIGGTPKSWTQEYYCCIRTRLKSAQAVTEEAWWYARASEDVIEDVRQSLMTTGFSFLAQFATHDHILRRLDGASDNLGGGSSPPRLVKAVILAHRGEQNEARLLLNEQARGAQHSAHRAYVLQLAATLGVGVLDG